MYRKKSRGRVLCELKTYECVLERVIAIQLRFAIYNTEEGLRMISSSLLIYSHYSQKFLELISAYGVTFNVFWARNISVRYMLVVDFPDEKYYAPLPEHNARLKSSPSFIGV